MADLPSNTFSGGEVKPGLWINGLQKQIKIPRSKSWIDQKLRGSGPQFGASFTNPTNTRMGGI